ncbi:hypothetical protein LY78DRAFT_96432 [Colletotrichum sublineola]|nr:hypothetical protein LY78DRAFT_96432 [Colletotrichum sublineola]
MHFVPLETAGPSLDPSHQNRQLARTDDRPLSTVHRPPSDIGNGKCGQMPVKPCGSLDPVLPSPVLPHLDDTDAARHCAACPCVRRATPMIANMTDQVWDVQTKCPSDRTTANGAELIPINRGTYGVQRAESSGTLSMRLSIVAGREVARRTLMLRISRQSFSVTSPKSEPSDETSHVV